MPDAELYVKFYNESKSGKNIHFPNSKATDLETDLRTPIFYLNRLFCGYRHKFIFDEETLLLLLQAAGFTNVNKKGFMHGQDNKLLIDLKNREIESLYVEAIA
ncbi:MAG: hypothetical protein NTX01_09150 [Candidatus Omnitrophica bacterium]|nr:hypothetical protein [Candidatus Omnitrophota bacterium]